MTRNQYVKWLKLLDENLNFDALVDGKEEVDMHEMIFDLCEELAQEPCDAVSREKVLQIVRAWFDMDAKPSELKNEIENLPSVTPAEKVGHWTHDGSHWKNRWICSECGYKLIDEQTMYCPNCGRKMREEEDT